jgi:hypothetical protein
MNPRIKLHIVSAFYCVLLAGGNWFRFVKYARQYGNLNSSYNYIGLALIASIGLAL